MNEAPYRCASALAAPGYYVDKAAAEQAVALALPMLESAMRNAEVGESGFLYIVVVDPAITPHAAQFEDAVLYEHAIGDPAKWDADYASFARAKARLSWLHARTAIGYRYLCRICYGREIPVSGAAWPSTGS